MAVTGNVKLTCKLTDGSIGIITLPAPINNTLTDEDSGDTLYDKAFEKIKAVYETQEGYKIVSVTIEILKTTHTVICNDYTGIGDD